MSDYWDPNDPEYITFVKNFSPAFCEFMRFLQLLGLPITSWMVDRVFDNLAIWLQYELLKTSNAYSRLSAGAIEEGENLYVSHVIGTAVVFLTRSDQDQENSRNVE